MRIAAPFFAVTGTGAGDSSSVLGDAPPSLDGDDPPDKGSLTTPGKGSAGDAGPGKKAAGVSKSLEVRSRVGRLTPALADRPTRYWRSRG